MSLLGFGTWQGARGCETALAFDEDTLTWAELDALLNCSTNALLTRDVGRDRRVAVFAENSPNTVVAYLTGILAGCSCVPVNYHLGVAECAHILRDSGARLIFAGPENVGVAVEAASRAGDLPVVAWGVKERADVERWEDFIRSGSAEEPPEDLRPLPYLHYTSGTTGFPKGTESMPHFYAGGDAQTMREQVRAIVEETPADMRAGLVMAPLYHFAQISRVKRVILAGRTLILYKRFDPEQMLRAIERHGITDLLMVTTQFVRLLALPEEVRSRYDLSSIKRLVHGAGPCPVEVKQQMIDWFGPVLIESYGATETGLLTRIGSEEWVQHPGSVGKVLSGLEALVVDDDGNELGPNQVGRLYFHDTRGSDLQYHNDDEKTRSAHLRPGVWTLGDVGFLDDEGYLFLTGRFTDVVNSGGVKIYPAEAEQVIMQLRGVADVACIGIPDDDLGEVLRALVVPLDVNDPPSSESVIAQTQQRLAKYKCPRTVEFVGALGRMPVGKLNKQDLRRRYLRGEVPALPLSESAAEAR